MVRQRVGGGGGGGGMERGQGKGAWSIHGGWGLGLTRAWVNGGRTSV